MRAKANSPSCSSSLTIPAGSLHTLHRCGTRLTEEWNALVGLVHGPYGYEDLNNLVHPNHKNWEQVAS